MENTNQPKKRGRKKKTLSETPTKPYIASSMQAMAQSILNPPEEPKIQKPLTEEELEEIKRKRNEKIYKLKNAVPKYEAYLTSKEFLDKVELRFMNSRYPNYQERDEMYDLRYSKLYNKIKDQQSSEYEMLIWDEMVVNNAIEKVVEIIDNLLSSGPLTESESSILNKCMILFKSYYKDRNRLRAANIAHSKHYIDNSFVPEKNSTLNEFFTNISPTPSYTVIVEDDDSPDETVNTPDFSHTA